MLEDGQSSTKLLAYSIALTWPLKGLCDQICHIYNILYIVSNFLCVLYTLCRDLGVRQDRWDLGGILEE